MIARILVGGKMKISAVEIFLLRVSCNILHGKLPVVIIPMIESIISSIVSPPRSTLSTPVVSVIIVNDPSRQIPNSNDSV